MHTCIHVYVFYGTEPKKAMKNAETSKKLKPLRSSLMTRYESKTKLRTRKITHKEMTSKLYGRI
jgi:hypothetical protein